MDDVMGRLLHGLAPLIVARSPASPETWAHAIAVEYGIPDADVHVTLRPDAADISLRLPPTPSLVNVTLDIVTEPREDPDRDDDQP